MLQCITVTAGAESDPNSLEALVEAGGKYVGIQACRQCHDSQHQQITQESHGQAADARTPYAMNGCESCHGPGEKHIIAYAAAGDKDPATIESGLVAYAGPKASPVAAQNTMCLQCHEGGVMMNWHDSLHEIEEVPCTACHNMHRPDLSMDRETEAEACYDTLLRQKTSKVKGYRELSLASSKIGSNNARGRSVGAARCARSAR